MDALTFHLMVNHLHLLSGVLGTLFVLLATVIRGRTLWRAGTATIAVAALPFYSVQWTGDRATGRAGVASWCRRGAVVVTALASTAATVRTAYLAGFIAHRNPLLMRASVPPADSIPARPAFGPRPPE